MLGLAVVVPSDTDLQRFLDGEDVLELRTVRSNDLTRNYRLR